MKLLAMLIAFFLATSPAASGREVSVVPASVDYGRATPYDGANYHGRVATGARFNPRILAIAHRTLPLRSCVGLAYRGRAARAVVNDRGPCFSRFCQRTAPRAVREREVDMTPALARALRFPGLGRVKLWRVPCA